MKKILFDLVSAKDNSVIIQLIKIHLVANDNIQVFINSNDRIISTFSKENDVSFLNFQQEEILKKYKEYDFVFSFNLLAKNLVSEDFCYFKFFTSPGGKEIVLSGFNNDYLSKSNYEKYLLAINNIKNNFYDKKDSKLATTSNENFKNFIKIELNDIFSKEIDVLVFDKIYGNSFLNLLEFAKNSSLKYIENKENQKGTIARLASQTFMGMYKKTPYKNYLQDYFYPYDLLTNKKTNIFLLNENISFNDLENLIIKLK